MKTQTWKSPVGRIYLAANDTALTALAFDDNWPKVRATLGSDWEKGASPVIERAIAELNEYFAGKRTTFTVPLELGGTPFQKCAWQALLKIPYGKTASYAEQAAPHQEAHRDPRRGPGQRAKPNQHPGALPSRDQQRGRAHGLCGRAQGEKSASRTRRSGAFLGALLQIRHANSRRNQHQL